jgi:hypothetical protein
MKLTPVIRKHIITLIITIYVIYRFVDVGLTRPHNHLEDVRQGTPVSCEMEPPGFQRNIWLLLMY